MPRGLLMWLYAQKPGMSSIGVNINAMRVQRSLAQATSTLSRSLERLSSGMRINSASDDAAGLAIADRLRANTRLYTAAQLNTNDAVSAIRIASSAIDSQKLILTRLKELAVQSMNGVYSNTQREAMNNEYQALLDEFGRIGDSSEFNGIDLLKGGRAGSVEDLLFQIGINGSSSSQLALGLGDTASLSGFFNVDDAGSIVADSSIEGQLYNSLHNLVIQASVVDENGRARDLLISLGAITQTGVNLGTADIVIYQRVSDTGGVGARTGLTNDLANQVNSAEHDWVVGGSTTVSFNVTTGRLVGNGQPVSFAMQFDNRTVDATLSLDVSGLSFQLETNPLFVQFLGYKASPNKVTSAIDFTGVDTSERASAALDVIDNRFLELADIQSRLGAMESRLASVLKVSQAAREGTQAAESRIRDVDIAEESAQAVRARILQQTAAAVLKQASLQPELAVRLLSQ